MAHRSDREPGHPAVMSKASKPAKQSGTWFADTIRASGLDNGRINRPDTRLHPTKPSEHQIVPCNAGAIHTGHWLCAAITRRVVPSTE